MSRLFTMSETKSWSAQCSLFGDMWNISIEETRTLSADFNKWQILMKQCATARQILLYTRWDVPLDYTYFNKIYVPEFYTMLKNNKVIETLLLRDVLNSAGMKCICKVLQSNNTITDLKFQWNEFGSSIGSDLEHLVLHNKCIKSLLVDHAGNEVIGSIAKSLPHNSTLNELGLPNVRDNEFVMGKKVMRLLLKALLLNHSLTSIDLENQNIGDDGAKDLCSVLEVNHTITHINLNNNRISAFPEAFAFLTHIETLYLARNPDIRFPPKRNVASNKVDVFFAKFRRLRMRFHFLLGFHKRIGMDSSIQSYLNASAIFEPALLGVIFQML